MKTMRVAQVPRPQAPFEIVERAIPEPAAGWVRIKVQACGVCHSDALTKEGTFEGLSYPRVPGHEVVGVIDAVGSGAAGCEVGQRVGVGWHGGSCGHCNHCRRGDFFACPETRTTGVTYDGGYAEYMVAPAGAVAHLPDGLEPTAAAPLLCAGLTTFNALRNSGARPGDLVAILGLGGLGHLGVQFAAKMGFHTVGIARGGDKEELARRLGADHYIDSRASDPADELQQLGGAKVILATVTAGDAMSAVAGGLGVRGSLIVVGAVNEMQISPLFLLMGNRRVQGWYSGTSIDSEDTLAFSARTGVRSLNECFPLEKVADAYEHMISGKARFRAVLTME
ncbi:MAG: alcohol dehydrogenase catalytic domain-containing protein [Planctomycetaceae bacterium]|nr:alcohol dehydrogenase catalytic domain-containing protein [Planctomycetaceae bacterium]